MSERTLPDEPDPLLDAATAALRFTPIPAEPPELATTALVAMRDRSPTIAKLDLARRRKWLRRAAMGCLAVSMLLVVGAILFRERAVAFDEAIDKVRKATAVRLQIHADYGNGFVEMNTVTIRGEQTRIDGLFHENITAIYDRARKVGLLTHPRTKRFQPLDLRQGFVSPVEMGDRNVLDELLDLQKQPVSRVGTAKIAGETADHFAFRGATAFHLVGDWEIWIGRSTELPIKVRFTTHAFGRTVIREYDAFEWEPTLASDTFDTVPPEGYRQGVIFTLEDGGVRIVTDPNR